MSSVWRHLDFGRWQVQLRAGLRRLRCPTHGVRVKGVAFARSGAGFSRDFEDLVAYLATKTDKTTITRLSRVDWDTVGRVCARVVAEGLDPTRLDGLVRIGVDEVSSETPPPLPDPGHRPRGQEDRVGCTGQGHRDPRHLL